MTAKEFQEKVVASLRKIEVSQAICSEMHKQHLHRLDKLEKVNEVRRSDWKSILLLVIGAALATIPGFLV